MWSAPPLPLLPSFGERAEAPQRGPGVQLFGYLQQGVRVGGPDVERFGECGGAARKPGACGGVDEGALVGGDPGAGGDEFGADADGGGGLVDDSQCVAAEAADLNPADGGDLNRASRVCE